jgi:hypothetical protein
VKPPTAHPRVSSGFQNLEALVELPRLLVLAVGQLEVAVQHQEVERSLLFTVAALMDVLLALVPGMCQVLVQHSLRPQVVSFHLIDATLSNSIGSGFTLTSSKGKCGISGSTFSCGSGVTATVFTLSGGYLAYSGSTTFYSTAVPSGSTQETVSTASKAVSFKIQWAAS